MRYYCMIRVDLSHKGSHEDIKELNEMIENSIEEWDVKKQEQGINADIGWNWSEHKNV